ncbi:MAG: hypothetical protein K0S29_545 [Gammaproteobacteria bacterium]|nr:hypothetical protein [Gammaproteobacteria bacterium]
MGQKLYSGKDELLLMDAMAHYNQHIVDLLKATKPDFSQVTDFGAGMGSLAKMIKAESKELVCIEIDPELAAQLRQDGYSVLGSLDEVTDGSQSLIYSSNVLEHIKDDLATLQLMHKKLKPDGTLFIYVPAFNCLYTAMDKKVGHYRRYSKKGLKSLLKTAGFEVKSIGFVDSLGFFAALAFKLFANKSGDISLKQLCFYDQYIFPISCFFDRFFRPFFGKNLVVLAVLA